MNTVREFDIAVREVRNVFRKMRKIHALKFVPGSNESNARSAFVNVSCTRSSASLSSRACHRAWLYSAPSIGTVRSSNLSVGRAFELIVTMLADLRRVIASSVYNDS